MYYNNPEVVLKTTENEIFLTLEYDSINKWGYSNWFWQFEHGEEYVKVGGEAMLKFVEKYKFDRWLNDNRLINGGWDGVNDWVANDWLPRLLKLGVKHYGVVNSPELIASLSSEFMEENVNFLGLNMRNLRTIDEAIEWLKRQ